MVPTKGVRGSAAKALATSEEGERFGRAFALRGIGSEHPGRAGRLAMPFWAITVFSVVGILVLVWVMYLVARRWM
jgi:hypothetical protein